MSNEPKINMVNDLTEAVLTMTIFKYNVMDKDGKLFKSTENADVADRMAQMIGGYVEEWEDEADIGTKEVPLSELTPHDSVQLKDEYKVEMPQGIYALWDVNTIFSRFGYKSWDNTEDVVLTDFRQQDNGLVGIWSASKPFKHLGYAFPQDLNIEEAVKVKLIGITTPAVNIRRTNLNLSDIIDIAEGKFAELVESKSTNGFYRFFDRSGYIAKEFTEVITTNCAVMNVRIHEFYKKHKAREDKEREGSNTNGQQN